MGNITRRKLTFYGFIIAGSVFLASCEDNAPEPDPQVEVPSPNALTDREIKAFDKKPDGSLPSFTVNIGDSTDPFYMPKLFRMEMELVNAKYGQYTITPHINKKSLEGAINKGKELDPGKIQYGANIAFVIKKADGSVYSPTGTETIIDEDDNNPLTLSPYLGQLPEEFTMDLFKQYNPASIATKSYSLDKGQTIELWIEVKTVGRQFATVKLPLLPVQALATANN